MDTLQGRLTLVGKVRKSVYRQPVTPDGIKKIESGELKWFDIEMFSNLNSGVLEQYLDEKNRNEGFGRSRFVWRKVFIGILMQIELFIIELIKSKYSCLI